MKTYKEIHEKCIAVNSKTEEIDYLLLMIKCGLESNNKKLKTICRNIAQSRISVIMEMEGN